MLAENYELPKDMIQRSGVSRTAIYNYLNEMSLPSAKALKKICVVYKVSADWLMGLSDDRPKVEGERIILSDEDLSTLCVCAARYSFLRKTYMPDTVCGIIRTHLTKITDKNLGVLIKDIDGLLSGHYRDKCEEETWTKILADLNAEMGRRKKCCLMRNNGN